MKSVTFRGTRGEVKAKADHWKQTHPNVRIVSDCSPAAITDVMAGPRAAHNEPFWTGTIHYEEPSSD